MNLSPTGFSVYAEDFLNCFDSYAPEKTFSPVKNYLVCRSLELSLKSYLSLKGMSIKQIKDNYGHDLSKVLKKAKKLGLLDVVVVSQAEEDEIEKADEWYKNKRFEYLSIENVMAARESYPDLNILRDLAHRLVNTLQPICMANAQQS